MIIGRFVISNTGATPHYPDSGGVKVYLNSKLLGVVQPSSRDALKYIRKHKGSKYASHLRNILVQAGATQEELQEVFTPYDNT